MTLLPIATYSEAHVTLIAANSTNSSTGGTSSQNHTMIAVRTAASMYRDRQRLYDIVDAARNICNLTLSLLFTLSLAVWGFLVNRQSAWRTDGGTAIFGAGALFLALISTGLNFLQVFTTPTFEWLSALLWAVILWQSFLGWWWWVGSASDIAEKAERELREAERRGRKERKRTRRKKRQATGGSSQEEDLAGVTTGTMARLDRWRSTVGATISRRRPTADIQQAPLSSEKDSPPRSAELSTISSILPEDSGRDNTSISTSGSTSMFAHMRRAWRSLRQAHIRAAQVQAIEQRDIQLQMQLENGHGLGRFPGGPGNDIDMSVFRQHVEGSDGDISPPRPVLDSPRTQKQGTEGSRFGGLSLAQTLRKWRLRDSTTY